jgi:hypothetical protein
MAAGRAGDQAYQTWLNAARYVLGGDFNKRAAQTMGGDIRRLLQLVESGSALPGSPEQMWELIREMTRLTLLSLQRDIQYYQTRGQSAEFGVGGRAPESYPISVSNVLFGRTDPRYEDIGLSEVNKAAARLIGTFARRFVDVIPEPFRIEATPPGFRAQRPTEAPPITVNFPVEEVRAEIKGLGEELTQRVEQGLSAGFDKITAYLPILVRGATGPAPPPAAPVPPAPAPAPGGAPGGPSEAPVTRAQRTLFGERIAPTGGVAAPPTLAQQLEDRYAPLVLDDVIGNRENVDLYRAASQTGNFGKLYLVTGPPGIGKTTSSVAAVRNYLLNIGAANLFNPRGGNEANNFGIDPGILLYRDASYVGSHGGIPALFGDMERFERTLSLQGGAIRKFIIVDDVTRFNEGQQEQLLGKTRGYPRTTFFFNANSSNYIPALESSATVIKWRVPLPVEVEARLVDIIEHERFPFPDPVQEARSIVEGMRPSIDFRQAIIRLANDASRLGAR